jgi:hypothetical protein
MRRLAPALALLATLAAAPAAADLAPICLDGWFDDWAAIAPLASDQAGDDGSSGIDFTDMYAANDQDWLFIRFATGADVQPDEQQDIRLYLDTDMNAGTGYVYGGIGAELVWNLGQRDGAFYRGGTTYIDHPDIGLQVGPTVSSTEFEIALRRDAVPAGGLALFPGATVRFVLRDAAGGGDVTSPVTYTFAAGDEPVASLPLDRADPSHLRLATWNVQNDGLFDGGGAEAAQGRLLAVMDPDVLIVCEVWNHSASQVAAKIEEHLPSGPGEQWYAVGLDGGNVICSRLPVLDSWEITYAYRNTAALLELGPDYDHDVLVIASHWRCCTADSDRQNEADAIVGFLRDAKTPGGVIDLPEGTPFLMGGDLNLVGWRQQLVTLMTGDIQNEGTFGPDAAIDWDGGDFTPVISRHPDQRSGYTWFADYSSYYPGMLDWILYSASAATLENHYVLETRTMTSATLSANGLQTYDTTDASDHAARVADFSFGSPLSAVPQPSPSPRARLLPNAPNPFNPSTQLRFAVDEAGDVGLAVYDARGRLVRDFGVQGYAAGEHGLTWDGRDDDGRALASGVYLVRLTSGEGAGRVAVTRAVTLVE